MSQHDFNIANQTASSARSDINNALQALASTNSGSGAPSTTYANMLWYETDTNRLKMRNEANTAWLDLGYIDQSDGLEILDNTKVVNTSGTQTGILGDQSTATWQAGTGTTDSLVSPANVKAAINSTYGSVATSGASTFPSNNAVAWNHGVGATPDPDRCGFYLVWKGGSTQGVVNGDRVHVAATGDDDATGFMFISNATQLKLAVRGAPVVAAANGSGITVLSSSNVSVYFWVRST